MRLQIGEVIAKVIKAETPEEKVALLREYNTAPLREVVKVSAGVDAFVALPDSEPPYKPSKKPYPYNEAKLVTAWKAFRIFRDLRARKNVVEFKFIDLLENLHAEEAKFLLDAHLRRLDLGLDIGTIGEALGLDLTACEAPKDPEPVIEERKVDVPPPAPADATPNAVVESDVTKLVDQVENDRQEEIMRLVGDAPELKVDETKETAESEADAKEDAEPETQTDGETSAPKVYAKEELEGLKLTELRAILKDLTNGEGTASSKAEAVEEILAAQAK